MEDRGLPVQYGPLQWVFAIQSSAAFCIRVRTTLHAIGTAHLLVIIIAKSLGLMYVNRTCMVGHTHAHMILSVQRNI
jgi:hypothetical protein